MIISVNKAYFSITNLNQQHIRCRCLGASPDEHSISTDNMHALLQITYRHHVLVGRFTSVAALVLIINQEDLAVKRAREQSGCVPNCGWLGQIQFARIACLLRSFAVSSCSCCIDPSVKIQEGPLRADWLSWKSGTGEGTGHNSVRGEQITP